MLPCELSRYTITRLIRLAIHLGDACEIDGIRFEPIEPFRSEEALVSETVEASRYREASKLFDRHLLPVVDAVTVVTGAALAPLGGSTLIEKARSKYVYLHAVRRRPSGSLTMVPQFHGDLIDRSSSAAKHLRANDSLRHAAYYLRQAALAESILTSTFHSLQAAEALAGRTGKHKRLKQVMGEPLYRFFYTPDSGASETRRNALAHGRLIEEDGLTPRTTELQETLLSQVRDEFGGKGEPSFTPVRGFVTWEPMGLFLEPLSELPPLKKLSEAAHDQIHSASDPRLVGTTVSKRLFRTW
jgi:hypothetical protein